MSTTSDPLEVRLRALPAVHQLVAEASGAAPRWAVVEAARRLVAARRAAIHADLGASAAIAPAEVAALAGALAGPSLRRVVNATGVVLHTNLGRAPLAAAARRALDDVARGYSNLEYDLDAGERGSRQVHAEALLDAITGAEAACVVNNNAAALVLALSALGAGRDVIVSRGELVEIGGSFRIPDILRTSGCTLVEVGTTNKTRRSDYEAAINDRTALLLKVHRSNFAVVGFTAEVDAAELVEVGQARGVATVVDLGSGCLWSTESQRAAGVPAEPTVPEVVASGADLVCFSADKLLGGPQAGVLVGTAAAIGRARQHPLMRALRPDKLTIAALAATLGLYREGREAEIPTIAMLSATADDLRRRAEALAQALRAAAVPEVTRIEVVESRSAVGGGAMPLAQLSSWSVALTVEGGPDRCDARLRRAKVPVIARIEGGRIWFDVRTIGPDEPELVVAALSGTGPR